MHSKAGGLAGCTHATACYIVAPFPGPGASVRALTPHRSVLVIAIASFLRDARNRFNRKGMQP